MAHKNSYQTNISKLYVIKFLGSLNFIGGILIPFFIYWGQLDMTRIMTLQSIFMLSIFIFEIPTGAFGDVFGRKFSIFLGLITAGIGAIVYILFPSFWLFALGEMLWGLGHALISGSDNALLYDSLIKFKAEKTSKKIITNLRAYSLLAIVIGSPIGAVVASIYGLRVPMMLAAITFFMAAIAALTLKEVKTGSKKHYRKTLFAGVKYFKNHPVLKILTFDMVSIWIIAFLLIWFWQKLFMNAGVDIKFYGVIHAIFVLSQIFIIKKYSFFEKIFRSKKGLLLYSAIIMGIFYIIGGLTLSVPILLSVVIIGGGFGLAREPLYQSYLNKYIPSNKRATVLSTISMIWTLSLAIIYPLAGYMADWSLPYTMIILGSAAILLSAFSRVEEDMLID